LVHGASKGVSLGAERELETSRLRARCPLRRCSASLYQTDDGECHTVSSHGGSQSATRLDTTALRSVGAPLDRGTDACRSLTPQVSWYEAAAGPPRDVVAILCSTRCQGITREQCRNTQEA